jgi:hypothetical protein
MTGRRVAASPRRPSAVRWALGAAALLGAVACQSQPTPSVQGEPTKPSAQVGIRVAPVTPVTPVTPPEQAPASPPSSQVGLARYEEPPTAAADAPSKSGQTVQGTVVKEEPFSIWLQAVSPVAAGSSATVEAVLVANPPYHCNAEYPHKFKLGAPPAGISYPEATVKGAKVTAERSVLAIPVQAQSPGKATVSGTLQFSVCNDDRCLVEKRELALNIEVKPAAQ